MVYSEFFICISRFTNFLLLDDVVALQIEEVDGARICV